MNTPHKIDTLDEALRVIFLESAKESDTINSEVAMTQIISSAQITMSNTKKALLIEKLNGLINSLSFGQLLQDSMKKMNINETVVSDKYGIPFSTVEDLKNDKIYTNNVPIKIFKNLISFLNISFDAVEASVRKTFDILQSQASVKTNSFSSFSPAFRKGYYASRDLMSKNTPPSDGKELFENKEALEKYLSRLNELMNS